ncbi:MULTISPECIES: helix-turn-helix domain-containing protein [unclassified Novosphingobium]|uniref:helix-turn-helix domain-containing protein n=1 Tax=unclassified Novosphingobium TaxID=2644732 RepID=UPI00020EF26B|nr:MULTISPECIES: helix-turn-helix domain-containing protein [unclassified Novosphingobium]GFM27929.1 AraC family transcriptional regulator [Novosphingobium sp. PY1]CCA94305.1 AraC family transcriptional regulator [Novosphingobium sp. PP1Y]
MHRKKRPAVDTSIAPEQGVTSGGQPLSYNRAPAPDLAPWVGRLYVTKVTAPEDYQLSCGLFNDTACVRIQLAGDWKAVTATGPEQYGKAALFFGPQSRRMPVTVTGSFTSVGLILRPGACLTLQGLHVREFVDRLVLTDEVKTPSAKILSRIDPDGSPEDWLQQLEEMVRQRIEQIDAKQPDPIISRFEELAFSNPNIAVAQAARDCGVERRKLERMVSRDFGMSPKQVLRRARALDMASHLRGVADRNEGDEIALRYYDESHLIHEFTELFGMSPRQFQSTPQPILTLALESRQARRLEALKRLQPGEDRPWA